MPDLLGRRPLLSGAVALFLLLAAAYTASIGLRATRGASITGDEPFYLITTQSLIADGDLDLRRQYADQSYRNFFDHPDGLWLQSMPMADGRILSPHDPGLSVFLIPGFRLDGLRGAQVQMLLIAAATFALTYVLVASETKAHLASWLVTATVGLGASAFVYATEIYPEMPGALCLVLSLLLVRAAPRGLWPALALVLLLSGFVWLSLKYAPLAGLVAVAYLWRAEAKQRLLLVALGAASAGFFVWFHFEIFGHLTAYNINTVYQDASTADVLNSHLAFRDRIYRLWGLFIDERFGVGRWAPLLLLTLPALPLLLSRGRIALLVGALVLAQLAIATFVAITMMGYWFPGRTLMTVLPLAALPITVAALRMAPRLRLITGALGVYSLLLTLALVVAVRSGEVTLAVDPFNLQSPLLRFAAPLFPDYRYWEVDTFVLTVIWLVTGAAVAIALAWEEIALLVSRRSNWDLSLPTVVAINPIRDESVEPRGARSWTRVLRPFVRLRPKRAQDERASPPEHLSRRDLAES